jgi:thiosulfate/3-mercaptopyruvate sulfurtransferase
MKYLAGHLPDAISIPVYKAFGVDGRLLAPEALAQFVGEAGLGDDQTPILYDSPEGQNAAMLAWILEYLGCAKVAVMADYFEAWKKSGREVRYRPVSAAPRQFTVRINQAVRISLDDARTNDGSQFVDFRSAEEFVGDRVIGDDQPGHIPAALNIVWRELGNGADTILKTPADLRKIFASNRLTVDRPIIAYCRSGPRAALGYLALQQAGYPVRLFDGSWAQWSRRGLAVER